MSEITHDRKPLLFRVYEWPFSYFTGLLIGLAVVSSLALWSSNFRTHLQLVGIIFILIGWVLLIASVFSRGFNIGFGISPQTKLQKWIRGVSIVVGIALNALAWTFFSLDSKQILPDEITTEQHAVGNPFAAE